MKMVVLDRDGVINQDSEDYIRSCGEWQPIPGSIEAIARLSKAGYWIAVATNQSGIGQGLFSLQTLNAVHQKMIRCVLDAGGAIHLIVHCPHRSEDGCSCRKPHTGLLLKIQRTLRIKMTSQWLVGDRLSDLEAGKKLNMNTALVKTGKGERTLSQLPHKHQLVFDNLAHFVDALLIGQLNDYTAQAG